MGSEGIEHREKGIALLTKVVSQIPCESTKTKKLSKEEWHYFRRAKRKRKATHRQEPTCLHTHAPWPQEPGFNTWIHEASNQPPSLGELQHFGKREEEFEWSTWSGSQKQKARKRRLLAPKRLKEYVKSVSPLDEEDLVNFCVPTLVGDQHVEEPHPFLKTLLRCGDKYVSFPPVKPFIDKFVKELKSETMELQRVLTWHAFFDLPDSQGQLTVPPFTQLPYKRLFVSKRVVPPRRVEKRLGEKFVCIERVVIELLDLMRLGLAHISDGPQISRGLSFKRGRLGHYLDVVVEADKDYPMVVLSIKSYLAEATNNMAKKIHREGTPPMVGGREFGS